MDTDDTPRKLINHIAASTQALPVLSQLQGITLESIDIQNALCSVLEIDKIQPSALLAHDLTSDKIVELLYRFDFKQYHPEIIFEFQLESGNKIIPEKIPFLLTEKTDEKKGELWRVRKDGPDPWPSNPHACNYETGLRLHLGSGELFDSDRQSVEKISDKKLQAIRGGLGDITLPELI